MKTVFKTLLPALLIMLFLVSVSGCKEKEKTNNLTLHFDATYGNQDFALNTVYTDNNGRKLKFEKFKFFVSHVTLIKNDNSEVELKDVALIDFSKPASLEISADLDEADFKAIRLGFGVDSIQNESSPQTAPAGSALAQAGEMYWSWLKYNHLFIEGKYAEPGSENFYGAILYHVGTNPLYKTVTFNNSFTVCCGLNVNPQLSLDVKKIFDGPPAIDLPTEGVTESQENKYAIAEKFANNFSQAFTLK